MRLKTILISILLLVIFPTSLFASSFKEVENNFVVEDSKNYLIKTYHIDVNDENLFLNTWVEKNIKQNKINYKLVDISKSGGVDIQTKTETQIKILELNTKDMNVIFNELQNEIIYNQNGYIGKLELDKQSVEINTISQGSYNTKVTHNVSFSNYNPNDLYYIPKNISKNGVSLTLIRTDWQVQSYEYIAGKSIPSVYKGVSYYEGVKKVNRDSKYNVSAIYKGEVTKETIEPLTYVLKYEQIEENFNYTKHVPYIVSGTTILIVCVFFILKRNCKIYNYKNNKYTLIRKIRLKKYNPIIDLSRIQHKTQSNLYKVILSKNLIKKLFSKDITVMLNNRTYTYRITGNEYKNSFEIRI